MPLHGASVYQRRPPAGILRWSVAPARVLLDRHARAAGRSRRSTPCSHTSATTPAAMTRCASRAAECSRPGCSSYPPASSGGAPARARGDQRRRDSRARERRGSAQHSQARCSASRRQATRMPSGSIPSGSTTCSESALSGGSPSRSASRHRGATVAVDRRCDAGGPRGCRFGDAGSAVSSQASPASRCWR